MRKILAIGFTMLILLSSCGSGGDSSLTETELEMVSIPSGTFTMGKGGVLYDDETNSHQVTLSSYKISDTCITNQQYCDMLNWAYSQGDLITVSSIPVANFITLFDTAVRNKTGDIQELLDLDDDECQILWSDSMFSVKSISGLPNGETNRANHPVLEVSWHGAQAYCNWLSEKEGKSLAIDYSDWSIDYAQNGYRLPTEAQWEYASRGGLSNKSYPWGDDAMTPSHGNYCKDSDDEYSNSFYIPAGSPITTPAEYYNANGYGLYDMSGNVLEWCGDWYGNYSSDAVSDPIGPPSGLDRVTRGGCWDNNENLLSCAYRREITPDTMHDFLGFRVCSP